MYVGRAAPKGIHATTWPSRFRRSRIKLEEIEVEAFFEVNGGPPLNAETRRGAKIFTSFSEL
jgi:hypothetical protein